MSEERIRSFIAVDVNDKEVIKKILSFQKVILETNADIKLVNVENIHITLKFLGETPLKMVKKICEGLEKIQFSPFEINFKEVGVFPSMKRINVVWIGIHGDVIKLIDIVNQIESSLKQLEFHSDTKSFKPHLTVARVRSAKNKDKLTEVMLGYRNNDFSNMLVKSIKLKKSVLTPKGPIYSTQCEVKGSEM